VLLHQTQIIRWGQLPLSGAGRSAVFDRAVCVCVVIIQTCRRTGEAEAATFKRTSVPLICHIALFGCTPSRLHCIPPTLSENGTEEQTARW
jgi:hypothetical protein